MIRIALAAIAALLSLSNLTAQSVTNVTKADIAPLPTTGGSSTKDIPPGDNVVTRDGKQSASNTGTGTGKLRVVYSGTAVRSDTAPNTWIVETITEVIVNATDAVIDDVPNISAPKAGANVTVTGGGSQVTVSGDNVTVNANGQNIGIHTTTAAQNTSVNCAPNSNGTITYAGGGFSGSVSYAPGAGAWSMRRA